MNASISCAVVSESLWNCTADELLRRASSADPTPGGGSVAALTAAFGFGLVQMAIGVTLADPGGAADARARLVEAQAGLRELQNSVVDAVDRDVAEFDAVMAAYRMPRGNDADQAARLRAIDDATLVATRGPLGMAEAAIDGIRLANQVESLVKRTIVSDAEAGRDLLRGAACAALRTADINLVVLERSEHPDAPALRGRRDAAGSAVSSLIRADSEGAGDRPAD